MFGGYFSFVVVTISTIATASPTSSSRFWAFGTRAEGAGRTSSAPLPNNTLQRTLP